MSEAKEQAAGAKAGTEEKEGTVLNRMETAVKKLRPRGEESKTVIKNAVSTVFGEVLKDFDTFADADALEKVEKVLAEIDRRLSAQMNAIIHHPDFQKLEGSWRGLAFLVNGSETSAMLKIRVLNISKKEIYKQVKGKDRAGWDQTTLFKKVYEDEYGTPGGQPVGMIVGDYEFGPGGVDVQVLRGMSKIAAAAHAPFIAAAEPMLLGMEGWTELGKPKDLREVIDGVEHAAWRGLRDDQDARYVGLAMPRFLSRQPYGPENEPVEGFEFVEDIDGSDHHKYTWSNSAYAMAANINRAYYMDGWGARIRGAESGGLVENLPMHVFPTDDGGVDAKCPTEIAITDRREKELADIGLMPLSHYKNADYACFFGAQSLRKPENYQDPEDLSNEKLSCNLPYMFAICRFAHYLKCMVRDWIGGAMEREDVEKKLDAWIRQYCTASSDEAVRAQKPLRDAKVEVTEVEGSPGCYNAVFLMRPHYQLEELTASLRLASNLEQKGS
jgi:type VI secretion system protein ImpC